MMGAALILLALHSAQLSVVGGIQHTVCRLHKVLCHLFSGAANSNSASLFKMSFNLMAKIHC